MNGNPTKIEIIAPFSAAFDWMKAMLFRPFDAGRWLTIAFAAFIGGSWGALHFPGRSWGHESWREVSRGAGFTHWDIEPLMVALIVVAGLGGLVFAVAWMWICSRGRFIFTDCVVKQRAAIAEPWREFRREGNSYFLFSLGVAATAIVALVILVLIFWVPAQVLFGERDSDVGVAFFILAFIVLGFVWLCLVLFFALVSTLMVPVMYRRRCSAGDAFFDVSKLVARNPGPFLLFLLFGIALAIGVGIAGSLVACLTCCVGGLPYVSTVLLLPAIVWLATYKLFFLRQFGDAYDAWGNVVVASPAVEAPPPSAAP
jgi:hypothetical protein